MPFEKIYELVCDNPNCSNAMNHITGTKPQAKRQAVKYGHIVVGDKCYCNQECYDKRNIPDS